MPKRPDALSTGPFTGFSDEVLGFLSGLAERNERAWFNERKPFYQATVLPALRALVVTTAEALRQRRLPLRADPQKSLSRIYRDVLFSADKRPFKTHLSAVFDRSATRGGDGILYAHVQPGASFAALAFYQPTPAELLRLRETLVTEWARFARVLAGLAGGGLVVEGDGDDLKRLPRGFEEQADRPVAPLLKMRSFIVRQALSDEEVSSPDLPERLAAFAKTGEGFLRFGWDALG